MKERLYDVPVVGTALRVQDRYKLDAGDQFAGAIGFFGFLSLFPLLILSLSVLGFVLAGQSAAEVVDFTDRIQDAIPGFGAVLGDGDTAIADAVNGIIDNRGSIGVVGLVTLLVSGLRVINSAQRAMLQIFRIDVLDVPGWKLRLQQVGTLVALGVLAVVGFGISSFVATLSNIGLVGPLAVFAPIAGVLANLVIDTLLFLAAYRIFATADGPHWRTFVPGAILAGIGWTLLKTLGTTYVSGQVEANQELYGALGGVIALLLLLYLAGRLYVYGAELSAVLHPPQAGESPGTSAENLPLASSEGDADDPGDTDPDHEADMAADHDGEVAPRAPRLDAAASSPTVSDATAARLAVAPRTDDDEHGPRQAAAFAIAVGAVAGLAAALKPWKKK